MILPRSVCYVTRSLLAELLVRICHILYFIIIHSRIRDIGIQCVLRTSLGVALYCYKGVSLTAILEGDTVAYFEEQNH